MRQRFGASIGGPLNIPGIYKGGSKTFFFVNYNGSRGDSPYDAFSFVPTVARAWWQIFPECREFSWSIPPTDSPSRVTICKMPD